MGQLMGQQALNLFRVKPGSQTNRNQNNWFQGPDNQRSRHCGRLHQCHLPADSHPIYQLCQRVLYRCRSRRSMAAAQIANLKVATC